MTLTNYPSVSPCTESITTRYVLQSCTDITYTSCTNIAGANTIIRNSVYTDNSATDNYWSYTDATYAAKTFSIYTIDNANIGFYKFILTADLTNNAGQAISFSENFNL